MVFMLLFLILILIHIYRTIMSKLMAIVLCRIDSEMDFVK